MMRILGFLVLVCLFVLSACGSDPIKEDLMSYVNVELLEISSIEREAIDSYSSVSGENYTDDWTMYETMDTISIPTYESFVVKLESIRPQTKELREIHEIYIEGSNAQLQGFKMIRVALKLQSHDKVFEANELLDKGRTKIRQFQTELEDLMEAYNVEYENEPL
ncbi:hypothetical protein [Sutcliffiella rhizosphaerae]|uniref:Lipoprotein n=1 Tax=Sutcliffiella rhizosphaerae TaxID=2880967 RepID=A0ABN8A9U5_9BACI|nr:hypothetical protein [Sutcliffiella rhizosphaerae]CAG9620167.1 hypothetical protein BACCIP111883_00935 [Sutcliffiella rhizosphaerae]